MQLLINELVNLLQPQAIYIMDTCSAGTSAKEDLPSMVIMIDYSELELFERIAKGQESLRQIQPKVAKLQVFSRRLFRQLKRDKSSCYYNLEQRNTRLYQAA